MILNFLQLAPTANAQTRQEWGHHETKGPVADVAAAGAELLVD
jgi:hypothetical protein